MNYDLVGIGNALVDLEAKVDDAFIQQYSLVKGGMTLASPQDQNTILKALDGKTEKISSGGSAANTLHGFSVLGGKSYYLGRVANDDYGQLYTEDMTECGVGFPGPDGEPEETGTCVVLITPDSERTMLTHLGISAELHSRNVDPTIVKNSKCVYVEGYLWTGDETRAAAKRMVEIAQENKIPVAFTLSDAFVVNLYKESLRNFIQQNVDILFCNEVEARAMTDSDDAETAFEILSQWTEVLFLTRGAKGSWAKKKDDARVSINTFPIVPVDTTGAGDLYAAGALYGLINKRSLEESSIVGSYCASQVVTHLGARMPIHSHTEIEKILEAYAQL
ncbi:MAG: adenosine kinase [Candidatus Nitrohelix vancouverensis]|uniref:Adenosine kinase n=1 Tax=Candidatus Nitrohelix vancouverensis TaxID=2705534 RepID=A0A7T0BZQ4_9BACT|nr:MAG: adenosine kinase [Candidatus Nitrohelix vancouverensis]